MGSTTQYGHANGVGTKVRFDHLYGFHQIGTATILAIDQENNCIRELGRIQNRVHASIGLCSKTRGFKDGYPTQARFSSPAEIIADNQAPHQFLITDPGNSAIRSLNLQGRYVSTFLQDKWSGFRPSGITQNSVSGDLYLTYTEQGRIFHINYKTKTLSLLTGSIYGFMDGNFASALFWYPGEIMIIDQGRKLVVVDRKGPGLRLLDLQTNTTSTFCDKGFTTYQINGTDPAEAQFDRCESIRGTMTRGYSLLKNGNQLLIGGGYHIRAITG